MNSISLPPDLEGLLLEEANRRGTTPELLAVAELRRALNKPETSHKSTQGPSLFEYLGDAIGFVDGSDEPFSENCGERFTDDLVEKRRQGRL